jgi:HAE1 family hydrophobic/amphiphilic exporter-1
VKLADVCVDRPVFATMLVSALVVLGIFSYRDLGVDLFPKVDLPNIVITTKFPGAGPEEVESQVTKVIEEAVNTISAIDELRSTSFEGISQVVVVFKLSRDPSDCAQDVRDRIGRIIAKLPDGIDPPVIEKFDPDAAPVLTIVVGSPMPIKDLTEFARKRIKESLESVNGVGQITMVGGRIREIHVRVDPDRLRAYGLTPADVKLALQRQNVELPGGLIETGPRDLMLRTVGRITRVEDFERVVVRETGGVLVYLRDVAVVKDAEQELRTLARLNGQNAVALVVQKQSGTNTVAVVDAVKSRLSGLKSMIPKDMVVTTVRDQSRFILASFHAVMEHLILGGILASLVVLLFLGDFRTTVMVALSIPTSIIATFTVMRLAGFSLNNMTLLALTLAVGLVIDDAIVVHENAFRHMEELGKDRKSAAKDAAAEIGLAVMATTFSLVVIFLPVAFMPGIVGRFLGSFGLTMAFAILVSLLVSFTLTPMLVGQFLKLHGEPGHVQNSLLNRVLEGGYGWMLLHSLRHRWLIVLISVACVLSTPVLMKRVGRDFIPVDDQSEFLVNIRAAEGTSIHETTGILEKIENELRKMPEVDKVLTTIGEQTGAGVNEGQIYVALVDIDKRKINQFALMGKTREFLKKTFPKLVFTVGVVPALSGGGFKQTDLQLTFQGPELEKLKKYSQEIMQLLKDTPGVVDLDTTLRFGKPEVRVEVDRPRAASLGVDVFNLASTLRTLVGGDEELVTRYKDTKVGEEYEVRVRLEEKYRKSPEQVARLPIRARDGTLTIGAIAVVREASGPTQIDRYGRQRQVSILANLQGIGLGDAQERVDERLRMMTFEPGYSYGYLGRSKTMREQNTGFLGAFLLSTIFMYMILAAQFESFIHPVTILLSLPLCIPFGILSLILVGERMHLWSTLGLFMLFGIVKKNSILQVDYTNTLREQGYDRLKAIMQANMTRLRPILMTTLTLIAGMLPMAWSTGPGSGSRRGMAIVVIGGQALCLLITLLLTPVAYSLFDDIANSRVAKWFRNLLD